MEMANGLPWVASGLKHLKADGKAVDPSSLDLET